jgi:isopentenyl diphosphate isomerase/L-lactate dehydrogenase-like FMN-dependent dehydrogenase
MGGTGTGLSFVKNVEALRDLSLNVRIVHNVHFPETKTKVLGLDLKFPLIIAPIGGIAFNLGEAMSEEDYQEAIVFGAADAGIIAGTPDAVPIEVMEIGLAKARALGGGRTMPFVKPWELSRIKEELLACASAGVKVVAMDLDSVGLTTLRQMGSPAYPKDQSELEGIVDSARALDMAFVVKGIMGVEDALACARAGADGIVVSNHGGRVLDGAPATLKALPAIVKALKGQVSVLADGGIRSGSDILKFLAQGAEAVMIGRPFAVAAIGGGREGVAFLAETYRSQLERAMIMTGCPDVKAAGPDLLF